MKKADMIKEIQKHEAKLYLELHEYENKYAPDDGDTIKAMMWKLDDAEYQRRLSAWASVDELMKAQGIEEDFELEENQKAFELMHDLFLRREAAKGRYYDERGNLII